MLARRSVLLLVAVLSSSACARAVSVGGGPAPTYAIEVRNEFDGDMIVSYDDGGGMRALGTVGANRTERYIIASPGSPTIEISAVSVDRSRTFGPVSIVLSATESRIVTIR